jgi:gas vesicle protein
MNNERIYYSHDAEIHAVREMTKLMALCLMVGLGIGAGLALLFSPLTGKKVRDDLTRMVGQSWNNGREAVEPMVKRVEKEIGDLQKTAEEHLK